MKHQNQSSRGFTLVELLVVIAIIGILMALLLPAINSARRAARKTKSINNMRQVGLGILGYAEAHRGRWPLTTHSVEDDPITGARQLHKAWIYTVAPYLENVESVRICPEDPFGEERRKQNGTSYSFNGYLSSEARPPFDRMQKVPSKSKTIVAFTLADKKGIGIQSDGTVVVDEYTDHVHSFEWFNQSNIDNGIVFTYIQNEIAVGRYWGVAPYLYADGHVEMIPEEQIHSWAHAPFNFALPR